MMLGQLPLTIEILYAKPKEICTDLAANRARHNIGWPLLAVLFLQSTLDKAHTHQKVAFVTLEQLI